MFLTDVEGKVMKHERGSILIAVVLAIIALTGLAIWMSKESGISVINQLELNQADTARNLASSGVEYVKGLSYSYQKQGKTFTAFKDALTANGGTYDLGADVGSFVVTVPTNTTSGTTTTYTVNVVGMTPSGFLQAKYQIPNTISLSYSYTPAVNPDVPQALNVADTVDFSGTSYYGDSIFKNATFNGGVKIYGSLDYVTTGTACLVLQGNQIGNKDGSSHICSDTCITLNGNVPLYGTVTAQGDVTINSGSVHGDIYSGGNVTIYGNSKVTGDVYAKGTINIVSGSITGDQVKLDSKPAKCTGYTLKDYVAQTTTQPAVNIGWTTTPYTIVGVTNINDKTYIFPSFSMSYGQTYLCLDLSQDNSYVNIFVNGDFSFAGILQLKTTSGGSCKNANSYSLDDRKKYAKRIYMAVGGKTTFSQDAHDWVGTIFSQGNITASSTMNVVGALYSKGTISTGGGVSSYFVMSDYANLTW
jgi:formylmethanofuran dehydrogenase subunit C